MNLLIPWNDPRLRDYNILVSYRMLSKESSELHKNRFIIYHAKYYMASENLTVFFVDKYMGSFGLEESALGLVADLTPCSVTTTKDIAEFLVMNNHQRDCVEMTHYDGADVKDMRRLLEMPDIPASSEQAPYRFAITRWEDPEWDTHLHVHGEIKCLS